MQPTMPRQPTLVTDDGIYQCHACNGYFPVDQLTGECQYGQHEHCTLPTCACRCHTDPQPPAAPCGCTFEGASDPVPGRVLERCATAMQLVAPADPHAFDWDGYCDHLRAARAYAPEPPMSHAAREAPTVPADCKLRQGFSAVTCSCVACLALHAANKAKADALHAAREAAQRADEATMPTCAYCAEPIAPGLSAICSYHARICIPCASDDHDRCTRTNCICGCPRPDEADLPCPRCGDTGVAGFEIGPRDRITVEPCARPLRPMAGGAPRPPVNPKLLHPCEGCGQAIYYIDSRCFPCAVKWLYGPGGHYAKPAPPPMAGGAPSHYADPAWYADEAWAWQEERNAESAREEAEDAYCVRCKQTWQRPSDQYTDYCAPCRDDLVANTRRCNAYDQRGND